MSNHPSKYNYISWELNRRGQKSEFYFLGIASTDSILTFFDLANFGHDILAKKEGRRP